MTLQLDIPVITTERLMLRGFEARDLAPYSAYYTGNRTGGVGGPVKPHQAFERFCSMIGHWSVRGYGRYAIAPRKGGVAFGHVGPMRLEDEYPVEMTWTLWDKQFEGQGFATEAARAVLDDLFANGWDQLIASIESDNTASIRLAERLGGVDDPAIKPHFMKNGRTYILKPQRAA